MNALFGIVGGLLVAVLVVVIVTDEMTPEKVFYALVGFGAYLMANGVQSWRVRR